MAEKAKEKKGIGDAAVGLGVVALLWALGKKPPPPPPGEEQVGAAVTLQIFDAVTGLPVPKNSPALVTEGGAFMVRVIVTNQSTKLGVGVTVAMDLIVTGLIGGAPFPPFPLFFDNQAFNAGQALFWDINFTVPVGSAGKAGELVALVTQPAPPNVPIVSSLPETLSIASAAISYKATVTLTVF